MSAIAALYNVPSVQSELDVWSFAHAAHHRDINRTIRQKFGVNMPEYVLDPLNINNTRVWLQQHQDLHIQQDAILAIDGFDLLEVELDDPQQFAAWIELNGNEHFQAANTLGIG